MVTGYSCTRHAKCIGNVCLIVSNLILAVEVHCHKVQGMTEAFFDSIILGKFICYLARLFGELNCPFLNSYTACP